MAERGAARYQPLVGLRRHRDAEPRRLRRDEGRGRRPDALAGDRVRAARGARQRRRAGRHRHRPVGAQQGRAGRRRADRGADPAAPLGPRGRRGRDRLPRLRRRALRHRADDLVDGGWRTRSTSTAARSSRRGRSAWRAARRPALPSSGRSPRAGAGSAAARARRQRARIRAQNAAAHGRAPAGAGRDRGAHERDPVVERQLAGDQPCEAAGDGRLDAGACSARPSSGTRSSDSTAWPIRSGISAAGTPCASSSPARRLREPRREHRRDEIARAGEPDHRLRSRARASAKRHTSAKM